jgi:hypothetical protein
VASLVLSFFLLQGATVGSFRTHGDILAGTLLSDHITFVNSPGFLANYYIDLWRYNAATKCRTGRKAPWTRPLGGLRAEESRVILYQHQVAALLCGQQNQLGGRL